MGTKARGETKGQSNVVGINAERWKEGVFWADNDTLRVDISSKGRMRIVTTIDLQTAVAAAKESEVGEVDATLEMQDVFDLAQVLATAFGEEGDDGHVDPAG